MNTRSRTERLDDLLTALGMLVEPIRSIILDIDNHFIRIPYVRAQSRSDYAKFVQSVFAFGREGKVSFDTECNTIKGIVWRFHDLLTTLQSSHRRGDEMDRFDKILWASQAAIRAIPADDPDAILPAASPFDTYLRLRAICSTAAKRIELFDPYLDDTPFHRYLSAVAPQVHIAVVTSKGIIEPSPGRSFDNQRRDRIVAVSELLAAERPDRYRFLVSPQQHDRHLRADDEILHLGGSVKNASKTAPYTIGRLDPTQSNHALIDSILAGAEEWFGRKVTIHRRR